MTAVTDIVTDRRTLLTGALGAVAATLTTGFTASCADASTTLRAKRRRRRASLVRDRLWMWGHGAHTLDGEFAIPDGPVQGLAKSALELGVPNLAVIRWMGLPRSPFGRFARTLEPLRSVAWSVVDSAPESTGVKINTALDLADRIPNLTTLYLDDLFVEPVKITPDQLADLRVRAKARPRPLDLAAVLYVSQLELDLSLLHQVDVVSLWAWDGADIDRWEEHMRRYRELLPAKRTVLGLYMWDFGANAPIGAERMQRQLDVALAWLQSGNIEGIVFHSSPLVSRPIAEVAMAKRWIARNGSALVQS